MKYRILFLLLIMLSITVCAITNPTFSVSKKTSLDVSADSLRMKVHVGSLCREGVYRTWSNTTELTRAGNYIYDEFSKNNSNVSKQAFKDKKHEYFNVISSYGPEDAPRLIIGAHYDVCGNQQGADDNASGTTAILELGRMLATSNLTLNYRIDLVAYTLEEPPFFRDFMMGSAVHARSLKKDSIDVIGMISVEMIGFYSNERGSQSYPVGAMKLLYPSKANYISIVSKFGNGGFLRKVKRGLKSVKNIPVRSVTGPASIPGIDFSDHLNYWAQDYEALMITDTSFYRNDNYHEPTDLPETLDYAKMASVTNGIFSFIVDLNHDKK